jgi:uncharacterized protein
MGEDNHRYCRRSAVGGQGASATRSDYPARTNRARAEFGAQRAAGIGAPTLQGRHWPARATTRRRSLGLGRDPRLGLREPRSELIAVDTNVLVHAYAEGSPLHDQALAAMERLVREPAWGLPWIVAGEFYSVLTDGRIWREPRIDDALAALDAWIATPGARLLSEAPDQWARLRPLLAAARPKGRKVHDARIAAVCLAAGVTELWTVDRDFSWYPALRVRNPLVEAGGGPPPQAAG